MTGGDSGSGTAGDFAWTVESSGHNGPLTALWGSSAGDVWAAGGGDILRSGGDGAWATVHTDANAEYQALGGAGGWIFAGGQSCSGGVCENGLLARSADHGATWTTQSLGSGVIGFAAAGPRVYAVSGDLYATSDGFATSTTTPLGFVTAYGLFADGDALYTFGGLRGAQIRRSGDDGQTWTTVYSGFSGSQSGYVKALARGQATLFAVADGCSVPACVSALLRSADGGATWSEASRPEDYVAAVWAPSDTELFVGGSALMRSGDGGATFTKVALPVDTSILALWGPGANELYAVGLDGTIFHGKR